MALTDGRYVTAAEFRAHVDITDTVDDLRLQLALDAAEDAVDEYCGRTFRAHNHGNPGLTSRTFVVYDPWLLLVDDIGDTSGLVVADGGSTLSSGAYQLEPVDAPQRNRPWTAIRRLGTMWTAPTNPGQVSVTVTARWGWPSTPEAVRRATIALAQHAFSVSAAPLGVAGMGEFGAVRVGQVPLVASMLSTYRRGDRVMGLA